MKRRTASCLILAAYCIPFAFLGMYGDYAFSSLWPYVLAAGAMAGLGWYCGKTKRIPLALLGNLLSLVISCLLTQCFATEHWNYYFKAFPVVIRTVWISGILLAIQAVPWWFAKITE